MKKLLSFSHSRPAAYLSRLVACPSQSGKPGLAIAGGYNLTRDVGAIVAGRGDK